jgi:hypothetical protein
VRAVRAFLLLVVLAQAAVAAPAAPSPQTPLPPPSKAESESRGLGIILEQVLLCRDLSTRQPTLSFGLAEKVYLVMTWKGLAEGPHSLRVSWINPTGRIAEETLYGFVVLGRTVRYDTWVWMQVKAPEPGVVYDYREVIGDWRIKAYLDGVPVIDSGFRLEREVPPLEGGQP